MSREISSREISSRAAIAVPRLPLAEEEVRPTFRRERAALKRGMWPVAGCDEAGRGPLAGPVVAAAVNGVLVVSTRNVTGRQTNFKPLLRRSAPGSKPLSTSTWNPLQIPKTSPPLSANSRTADITGENLAIAPQRR